MLFAGASMLVGKGSTSVADRGGEAGRTPS